MTTIESILILALAFGFVYLVDKTNHLERANKDYRRIIDGMKSEKRKRGY